MPPAPVMQRPAFARSPRRRRLLLGALLVAASVGQGAAPAFAQDDVIRVPSDSPAGKEYSVPLDDARRTGEPEDTGEGEQAPAAPFGAGLGDDAGAGVSPAPTGETGEPGATTPSGADEPGATTAGGSAASGDVGGAASDGATAAGGGIGLPLLAGLLVVGFGAITGTATLLLRSRTS